MEDFKKDQLNNFWKKLNTKYLKVKQAITEDIHSERDSNTEQYR